MLSLHLVIRLSSVLVLDKIIFSMDLDVEDQASFYKDHGDDSVRSNVARMIEISRWGLMSVMLSLFRNVLCLGSVPGTRGMPSMWL
ncbi:hypothetical protein BDV97DRAFT_348529, partial [Delphinella strobiligena]